MYEMQPPSWVSCATEVVAPARRADVLVEELDGEALLSDPASGHTHRLNQTALAIWRQCDGRTSTRQIAESMTATYQIDADTALDHVEQMLVLLAEAGLFEALKA
ncbi:MAG: PqqD family protein [Phycisphaerae bacterium]|nr:PqqD family protein [Phycisphaerae bacterium]